MAEISDAEAYALYGPKKKPLPISTEIVPGFSVPANAYPTAAPSAPVYNEPSPVYVEPYRAPVNPAPYWDSAVQAYRDPVSGLVSTGSDAAGWNWVPDTQLPKSLPAPISNEIVPEFIHPTAASPEALKRTPVNAKSPLLDVDPYTHKMSPEYRTDPAAAAGIDLAYSNVSKGMEDSIPWWDSSEQWPTRIVPDDYGYTNDPQRITHVMMEPSSPIYTRGSPIEEADWAMTNAFPFLANTRAPQLDSIIDFSGNSQSRGGEWTPNQPTHAPDGRPYKERGGTAVGPDPRYLSPLISREQPLADPTNTQYPSKSNYENWINEWQYYPESTRDQFRNLEFMPGDPYAGGGGGYYDNQGKITTGRLTDETMVHELAHSYWDQTLQPVGGEKGFISALERLASETNPEYAWPASLAKQYLASGNGKSFGDGGEWHGGLWSGVMGNIYQLPEYMWPYYSGMFDMNIKPEDTEFRTGSGYGATPLAEGPFNPNTPVSQVPYNAPISVPSGKGISATATSKMMRK